MVVYDNWCRIEGTSILKLKEKYGIFKNLSNNITIYCTAPEIQIFNPSNIASGVIYRVISIKQLTGYTNIKEIDEHYISVLDKINSYDKTINTQDDKNADIYYYEPFVISESSIVFYTDANTGTNVFDKYAVILIDETIKSNIVTITASYYKPEDKSVPTVPVGEQFNEDYLHVYAIYEDGSKALIKQGYNIEPNDKLITQLGYNVFKIIYEDSNYKLFSCTVAIEGIRNLKGISAVYDGPQLSYGQEALRKYFIVTAHFTDDTSVTVTQFSFPKSNIVTEVNKGIIQVFYQGFYADVNIPLYQISSSRLIAFYNGPSIEIGKKFELVYCQIKIYYQSKDNTNSYYEDIEPTSCTFSSTVIDHDGINYITVSYKGKLGIISTKMIVIGKSPEVKLTSLTATYNGSDIVQGETFSPERVIVKALYSDGSIVTIRNFSVSSNIISNIGANEILISYKEKDETYTTTITINGVAREDTTFNNYYPITLDNNYPSATILNNRYRGSAESYKHTSINDMIVDNIKELYNLFTNIEYNYHKLVSQIYNANNIKTHTLNNIKYMNYICQILINRNKQ